MTIINMPKSTSTIEPPTLSGLQLHIKRSLDFVVGPDGPGFMRNGPDIGHLVRLDRFVRLCLETTLEPFHIESTMPQMAGHDALKTRRMAYRSACVKTALPNPASRDARELADHLRMIRATAERFDRSDFAIKRLQCAPHIELLLEVFSSHPISSLKGFFKVDAPVGDTGNIMAEIYNNFVTQFRCAMRDRQLLRRERHNWSSGSRENVEHLHAYLDDLFNRHGSQTVVHLRLFHSRERTNLLSSSLDDQNHDLRALRACRTVFLDRIRKKPALFTDEPRCIWAIQPSLEGGYDLHVTLLFDTAALGQVLDDIRVEVGQAGIAPEDHTDQVGAYWVKVATGGSGDYLRADRYRWLYGEDWVHGEVGADDPVRREKLKRTLGYLAMRRALVRLKDEPSGAYFGMPERKVRAPGHHANGKAKTSESVERTRPGLQ